MSSNYIVKIIIKKVEPSNIEEDGFSYEYGGMSGFHSTGNSWDEHISEKYEDEMDIQNLPSFEDLEYFNPQNPYDYEVDGEEVLDYFGIEYNWKEGCRYDIDIIYNGVVMYTTSVGEVDGDQYLEYYDKN